MNRFFIRTTLALATLAAAGSSFAQITIDQNRALAGGLTPGDTPGFPITISQPGVYVLRGALNVPEGASGIEITAPNVTLDLGGFTITGPSTCTRNAVTRVVTCTATGSYGGVLVQGGATGAVVRKGAIGGFVRGVQTLADADLEDLRLWNNGSGAEISAAVRISRVTATLNGGHGLNIVGGHGLVRDTLASYNGTDGIRINGYCAVYDSASISNRQYGVSGASVRGVKLENNGMANRGTSVISMGGNLDATTQF